MAVFRMPASPSLTSFVVIFRAFSFLNRSPPRPKRWPREDSCHVVELVSRNEVVYQPHLRILIRFGKRIVPSKDSARCRAAFPGLSRARGVTVGIRERLRAPPRRNRKVPLQA